MYTKNKSNINNILVFLFCGIFIIASTDLNNAADYTIELYKFFLRGVIIHDRFFSIFDILLFIIFFWIITEIGINYNTATKSEKFLVVFAWITFILNMVNPNNQTESLILGLPLLEDTSMYSSLLFLTSIYLIKDNKEFVLLLKKIVPLLLFFVTIRAIVQLLSFAVGGGNANFFGVRSVLTENDTLLIFNFAQFIFLVLFLSSKNRKYLIISLVLILVQILSFRRSNLFLCIFVNLLILTVNFNISRKKGRNFLLIFPILIVVLFVSAQLFDDLNILNNQYIERYFGMFYLAESSKLTYQTDQGHFEHLTSVFYQFLQSDIFFWGWGYTDKFEGDNVIFTGGQGIHNAFIGGWVEWGFLFFIYMLGTVFIFLNQVVKTIKNINRYDKNYLLMRVAVISFFLGFLIIINFFGVAFFTQSKFIVLRTLILAFLIKVTPENFKLLYNPNRLKLR